MGGLRRKMVEVARMPRWYRLIQIFTVIVAITLADGKAAFAASQTPHSHRARHYRYSRRAAGPMVLYHAALLEDADTGRVLYGDNPNLIWPPASMAKMMLLLVASDQVAAGRVSFTTPVRISEVSAMTHGSRLGLHE